MKSTQRRSLNALRCRTIEGRRAKIFGSARSIFVPVIQHPFLRTNFDERKRFAIENPDRCLAPFDLLFDKQLRIVPQCLAQRSGPFFNAMNKLQADTRTLMHRFTTTGGAQPRGQGVLAESTITNLAVGTLAPAQRSFVSTLSNAIRLASAPQPV
jgi:hypothetical protein